MSYRDLVWIHQTNEAITQAPLIDYAREEAHTQAGNQLVNCLVEALPPAARFLQERKVASLAPNVSGMKQCVRVRTVTLLECPHARNQGLGIVFLSDKNAYQHEDGKIWVHVFHIVGAALVKTEHVARSRTHDQTPWCRTAPAPCNYRGVRRPCKAVMACVIPSEKREPLVSVLRAPVGSCSLSFPWLRLSQTVSFAV